MDRHDSGYFMSVISSCRKCRGSGVKLVEVTLLIGGMFPTEPRRGVARLSRRKSVRLAYFLRLL